MTRSLRVATEAALVVVTIAAVASLRRLFVDWSFFEDIVLFALIAHVTAIAVRRLGGGILISLGASLVALACSIGWVLYPSTLSAGLPSLATRDAARLDLEAAWDLFGQVKAPTTAAAGFVLACGVAVWLVAFLADWAAFRAPSAIEALLPAATLFVFVTLFAAPNFRTEATLIFGASAVLFVLLHRVMREGSASVTWLGGGAGSGTATLLRTGAVVGVIAVAGGAIAGPQLPGAEAEAVVEWRDVGAGGGSRVVISPLVNIQAQLLSLSDIEVFTVETDAPDYWRLTSLDTFTGDVWESSGSFSKGSSSLPGTLPDGTDFEVVRQEFTMRALGQIWLPAAYEPSAVLDSGGADPLYEKESGTLVLGRDGPDVSDGITYVLESRVPDRDLAAIQAGGGPIPAEIADRYLQLPGDFSNRVRTEAQAIVDAAGAVTPYEQALALQQFFRNNFTYDIEVAAGHSADSVEEFIFEIRRGYCEQFAGSYAAMARSLGMPARVAVGFTPGELDGDVYRVRGEHAHAWPEVWIGGIGWLRFEPTPGRGAPGDTEYTNVDPAQAVPQAPSAAETIPIPTTLVPQAPTQTTLPPFDLDGVGGNDGSNDGDRAGGSAALQWLLMGVVVLGGLALGLFGLLKANARARASHFRGSRTSVRDKISGAWEESLAYLELVDVRRSADETPYEFASRAGPSIRSRAEIEQLADLTTTARYAGVALGIEDFERAERSAQAIRTEVHEAVPRSTLLKWQLSPKPLLRSLLPGRT